MFDQLSTQYKKKYDINSKASILSLAWVGAIGAAVILLLPIIVGAFVDHLGFSEQSAGLILSIDMGGYTLATLLALFWIEKGNWRLISLVGIVGMLIGNLASLFVTDFTLLATIRFFTGFSAGTITAVVVAALGKTHNPDRSFGFWIVGQLLLGSVGFAILPPYVAQYGLVAIFGLIILLLLLCLPLLNFFPNNIYGDESSELSDTKKQVNVPKILLYLGVLSILVSYAGLTAVWSYVERIAIDSGFNSKVIGYSLSIASIVGILGGIGATTLGVKLGRIIPITIALSSAIVGIIILKYEFSHLFYTICCSLFLFGWNFMLPYFMGAIAGANSSSKVISLANASIGIGLMIGPGVGALLLNTNDYSLLTTTGVVLIAISYVLIAPLALRNADNVQ